MKQLIDHPLRFEMTNEMHARPFPSLNAPSSVAFLALMHPTKAATRDRDLDRAQLIKLLDRFGAPHPQPNATHYSEPLGRYNLKWEQHTEFVTYTLFQDGLSERAFDPAEFYGFPEDWLLDLQDVCVTSINLRVEQRPDDATIQKCLKNWFVQESVAVSSVLDGAAVAAGDFRLDASGHQRFAVFISKGTGSRRIGRIVQRICEIETYKTMSMLGFSAARNMNSEMEQINTKLSTLMSDMTNAESPAEVTLGALLNVSAELEHISAQSAFRFGATGAYEAIVNQRIAVLREERFEGRQTFHEFMLRRYDPAMRTVKSCQNRLVTMADRAMRSGDLLRTRVDVGRSAQNQALLKSMDRRADLQLRLQRTVESLSVVAISYYAVSLTGYLGYPLAAHLGISKGTLTAALTLPVVALVGWAIRRIRNQMT